MGALVFTGRYAPSLFATLTVVVSVLVGCVSSDIAYFSPLGQVFPVTIKPSAVFSAVTTQPIGQFMQIISFFSPIFTVITSLYYFNGDIAVTFFELFAFYADKLHFAGRNLALFLKKKFLLPARNTNPDVLHNRADSEINLDIIGIFRNVNSLRNGVSHAARCDNGERANVFRLLAAGFYKFRGALARKLRFLGNIVDKVVNVENVAAGINARLLRSSVLIDRSRLPSLCQALCRRPLSVRSPEEVRRRGGAYHILYIRFFRELRRRCSSTSETVTPSTLSFPCIFDTV